MITNISPMDISSKGMLPADTSPISVSPISTKQIHNNNDIMFKEYPDILSIKELQKALSIGRNTAYRLITDDKIKHLRVQGTIKIPKRFLIDFILSSCYNNDSDKSAVTGG